MKLKLLFTFIIIHVFIANTKGEGFKFFEVRGDTIRIYLDNVGDIVTKNKAEFYRETFIGDSLGFFNNISDFYLDNSIAYTNVYDSVCDKQQVASYFKNGQLRHTGFLDNFMRDSLWTFYYDDGSVQKKVIYNKDEPFVKEFYKKNGKAVFTNANGKYEDRINALYKDPTEHFISGKIKNGKMEGGWNWRAEHCQGKEYFKNGEFVKTETYGLNDGFKDPRIITRLCGYDKHEYVEFFKFITIPQENERENKNVRLSGIPVNFSNSEHISFSTDDLKSSIRYKGEPNLSKIFATDLASNLKSIGLNRDFWAFIQFSVLETGAVENVQVHSNYKKIINPIEEKIKRMNNFEPQKKGEKSIGCDIFLCVIFTQGKFYFPEYNFNNLSINLFGQ
jgi:antitoxin component YwqK of YwqJK toxin-antitoxin module